MRIESLIVCLLALTVVACERPAAPGHVRFRLDRGQHVSLGLFDEKGELVAQPVVAQRMEAGWQDIDCAVAGAPEGSWEWRAVVFERPQPEFVVSVAAGVADFTRPDALGPVAGGDEGPPCAVAADEQSVFLGWRGARHGHEVVAVAPTGRTLWGHHHGPERSGVRALAAAEGVVFVLGGSEGNGANGESVYKLDAQTGTPLPWEGREALELKITELWPPGATGKPTRASGIAARNGRVYVLFPEDQFIAGLDAETGNYVITLTGPQPGELALSTTPMNDPERPGQQKVIDFGVCAIAEHGLAYFLMEHDPAWVMASTTRWLQNDERIIALALRGDAMKTDKITIYTALDEPHHQIQLRPAEAAEGFSIAVGVPGGRVKDGPWQAEAFRDIQALAVDSTGQLWVAEGDENFGRFTTWQTEGKQGTLVREIFGPNRADDFAVESGDGMQLVVGGFRWKVDPSAHRATVLGRTAPGNPPGKPKSEYRDPHGLLLWSPKMLSDDRMPREGWHLFSTLDGRVFAAQRGQGVHIFALPGVEKSMVLATGKVKVTSGPRAEK